MFNDLLKSIDWQMPTISASDVAAVIVAAGPAGVGPESLEA